MYEYMSCQLLMYQLTDEGSVPEMRIWSMSLIQLGIEFYLFVSHGGMKRQRVHV